MPRPSKGFTPYAKHNRQDEHQQLNVVCRHLRKLGVFFFTDYAAGLNLTDKERIAMMKQRSHEGTPDLFILEPRGEYHGMVIEFKKDGTTVRNRDGTLRKSPYRRQYLTSKGLFIKSGDHLADQAAALAFLHNKKYHCIWGIGAERTIQLIDEYLGAAQVGLEF